MRIYQEIVIFQTQNREMLRRASQSVVFVAIVCHLSASKCHTIQSKDMMKGKKQKENDSLTWLFAAICETRATALHTEGHVIDCITWIVVGIVVIPPVAQTNRS